MHNEDGCAASISGIAPVAPMQTKVQSTAFPQTAFSEDDNDVDDEFSLSLMLKL
jgi:hypothetical protein